MWIYEPNEVSDVEFLEDSELIIVRWPSIPSDKYQHETSTLFSGQPRFTEECSGSILANVIQKHDVDVFAHLWFDEDLQTKPYKFGGTGAWEAQRIQENAIETFQKIYQPVSLAVEKSKFFGDPDLDADFEASEAKYW